MSKGSAVVYLFTFLQVLKVVSQQINADHCARTMATEPTNKEIYIIIYIYIFFIIYRNLSSIKHFKNLLKIKMQVYIHQLVFNYIVLK